MPENVTSQEVLECGIRVAREHGEPVIPLFNALGGGAQALAALVRANCEQGVAAVVDITSEAMGDLQRTELTSQPDVESTVGVLETLGFGGGYDLACRLGKLNEARHAGALGVDLQLALPSRANLAWLRESTVWWKSTNPVAIEALAALVRFGIGFDTKFRSSFLRAVGGTRVVFLAIVREGHVPTIEKLADAFVATNDEPRDVALFRCVPVEAMIRVSNPEALWAACGAAFDMLGRALEREGDGAQVSEVAPSPPSTDGKQATVLCTSCNTENNARNSHCAQCGHPLSPDAATATPTRSAGSPPAY